MSPQQSPLDFLLQPRCPKCLCKKDLVLLQPADLDVHQPTEFVRVQRVISSSGKAPTSLKVELAHSEDTITLVRVLHRKEMYRIFYR